LSGEDRDELAGPVEQAGKKFAAAMPDERKRGPGKRLFGGAASETARGVADAAVV
jgi:hypothetical protein